MVLLFSGGLDSTALAALLRPRILLYVDYGQRPAEAERAAATNIAEALGLSLTKATLGIGEFGSGLLHDEASAGLPTAPSPEWWPYRNQFLGTAGAAIALQHECSTVALGTVKSDGERHLDGTLDFYEKFDALVSAQEGAINVVAPGINRTTQELLVSAGLDESILGWTTSCHRSNLPCGNCPGCWKRQRVLASLSIPGYTWNDLEER
jgi:7-cyano-7-deazaguanine synthase